MRNSAILRRVSAVLAVTAMLATVLIPNLMLPVAAEATGTTNLIANAADVNVYRVAHAFDYATTTSVPDYTNTTEFGLGGSGSDTSGKFNQYQSDDVQAKWEAALYDGDTNTTPYKQAQANQWYTGIASSSAGSSTITDYRKGLMYDLGGYYDLVKITLSWGSDQRVAEIFSVYAGNVPDKSILGNCVGVGTTSSNTAQSVSVNLSGIARYVLIMFDKQTTDTGSTAYDAGVLDGSIAVTEICLEGRSVEVKSDLISKAAGVQLYEIKHQLDWSEFEEGPDYSNTADFRVMPQGSYGAAGSFWPNNWNNLSADARATAQANAVAALYDTVKNVLPFYNAYNSSSHTGIGGAPTGTAWTNVTDSSSSNFKPSQYRYALMYDLGGYYNLANITLSMANRDIYAYSVYAGSVNDKTILNNRIGRGARTSGKDDFAVTLNGMGRYVLIVFEYNSTDPGINTDDKWLTTATKDTVERGATAGQYTTDGSIFVTEIVLEGVQVAVETDLIAGAVDAKLYEIEHALNWQDATPDYSNDEMRLAVTSNQRGDVFGQVWPGNGATQAQVQEAALRALYDGDKTTMPIKALNTSETTYVQYDEGFGSMKSAPAEWINGVSHSWPAWTTIKNAVDADAACGRNSMEMKSAHYRNALMYDLGGYYELTDITLSMYSRTVFGYSVYAGNTMDQSILSNCIGRGSRTNGTGDFAVGLNGEGRYVLIVFDFLSTDPGLSTDDYWTDSDTKDTVNRGIAAGQYVTTGDIWVTEIALSGAPKLVVADESKGKVTIDSLDDGTVTVTAAAEGKVLAANGLTYTVGDKTYPIVIRKDAFIDNAFNADGETNTSTFTFKLPDTTEAVTVSAAFTDGNAANLGVIGVSVNPTADADNKIKMRFRSRVYKSYTDGETTYTVKEMGTLLLNTSTNDAVAVLESLKAEEPTYADSARLVKTTQLYDRCDAYYEYVCQLRFAAEGSTNLDKDYYAYAYAIYVDAEGNEVPVCSAV
ncbi:MAG: hypothetical protein IKA63_00880, partial [Clostridia bacterium]|nr:hypothetical protein [Clostridia bacterium]